MSGQDEKFSLDAMDLRILAVMQTDASQSVGDIAASVGLSQTPCWRRIKRMKDAGIITSIVATVDREAVGLGFTSYAFVKLALPSRDNMEAFDRLVARWPEVVTCERVTGAVDYLIKVVTTDIKEYDAFLRDRLLNGDLVSDVQSRIVVATVKETTALPLPHL
ncbi:Lrp/AsnC family transcriptional regulator [Acuticoccus sp. M5D2P5]|uniref:Lrp/AsnC family transcriptional regulator n=1 Tax=Acuticoccus kalidii TaxID=2910977 RepID=UPI001F2B3714|nr:Lrp/AsnC family transcriptional regulator [Acuticoccus kalidii]MCF3932622.1 Lrp/AsnC family transcriptional regulator [Acuticoccus kalidii]